MPLRPPGASAPHTRAPCLPLQPGDRQAAHQARLAMVGRPQLSASAAAAMEDRLLRRFYLQGRAQHRAAWAEERRAQRGLAAK
jgi:hypothetical protein